MRRVIAIDFDGCLCENKWPEIGAPNVEVIDAARREKQNGAALILWTCRVGERLGEAVAWCERLGLTFDAVNANLPERIAAYQNDCRKVNADEYWDDAAVCMGWVEASERDKILMDAVTTWGRDAQALMMIEEMRGGIARAVLDGTQVTITTNCWPRRGPVDYIRVSATKQTWNGMVTFNKKIPMENRTAEQMDEEIVHTILEMARTIELPHNWKE